MDSTSTAQPADTREWWSLRRQQATDKDCAMGMYNQSAIECVRSLLGTEQTNELYTQAGFKKRIIPLLSYPIAPIMELTLLASKALEARGLGFEQAIDRIGQGYVLTYLDSPMGAVLKRATAGDPWRVLMAVPMAYKTTLSYGVRSVERLGPGEALFTLSSAAIFSFTEPLPPMAKAQLTAALAREAASGSRREI